MTVFATLGLFIIDEFSYFDDEGLPTTNILAPQIGGGGTYAAIGARIWLPADQIAMMVDKGHDFPASIYARLLEYGSEMWIFREQPNSVTTKALNSYNGDHRNFEYLTPRIRLTPKDLIGTKGAKSQMLHFICSPSRAFDIMSEVKQVNGWLPTTIYEPIPDRCVPEELPALLKVLPLISILSPNAEEALSILSLHVQPKKWSIEQAADTFLEFGIGNEGTGCVLIRCGEMGAYVKSRAREGMWIDAFWNSQEDSKRIVDVTGAGNSFLGGLAAGLRLNQGDVYEATFYASVSASFVVEQQGLPAISSSNGQGLSLWNGDLPTRRLQVLHARHGK